MKTSSSTSVIETKYGFLNFSRCQHFQNMFLRYDNILLRFTYFSLLCSPSSSSLYLVPFILILCIVVYDSLRVLVFSMVASHGLYFCCCSSSYICVIFLFFLLLSLLFFSLVTLHCFCFAFECNQQQATSNETHTWIITKKPCLKNKKHIC